MTPVLTPSGLMLAVVGAAFVVAGVVVSAWPLLALGTAIVSSLFVYYVLFVSPAALLRRRGLELAWHVPAAQSAGGAITAGRSLSLKLALRNHSPFRLQVPRMQVVASSAIRLDDEPPSTLLPPRREVRLEVKATPEAAGHWFFQGLLLNVTDRFGVFGLQVYFPSLLQLKVFPRLGLGHQLIPFSPNTGAPHERVGRRLLRQRGLGTDLREVRQHIPGDPFKRIAWKATARTRKLMVREYESEILVTHWLLLDISSTMRGARPGQAKLDYGLTLCSAFARLVLDAGDRVGLATFDHRLYSRVPPNDGRNQLYRIVKRLMGLRNIVDEDLTDLTDAELNQAVANYLAYQKGVSVRVDGPMPPMDHPLREGFLDGPRGEVYNGEAMLREVRKLLDERKEQSPASWWRHIVASTPEAVQLRLFCRANGVEIPYQRHSPFLSKVNGMAEALHLAGTARQSRFIVLVSDLEQMDEPDRVTDALRLARRRGHTVVVVAPYGPDFSEPAKDEQNQRVHDVLSVRAHRKRRQAARTIKALGIPVLSAGPRDALPLVLKRLARFRSSRSGRPW